MQESETPTLRGLSFTVRPGELLAVVGPVGAGKVSCDALDATPQALLNSQEWNPELSMTQFDLAVSRTELVSGIWTSQ